MHDSPSDNTATRFYGGDLLGNLWRFDIDDLVQPNKSALLLAKFQIDVNTPQPITIKLETVDVSGHPVVVVATGRYLGVTDIENTTQQSIYGVRDTFTNSGWGDVRANTTDFVIQTFTLSNDANGKPVSAAVTDNKVDWGTKGGWRVDLPQTGERVSSNLGLQFSTLSIGTTIPSGNACDSGGASWRYYLNVANGGVINQSRGRTVDQQCLDRRHELDQGQQRQCAHHLPEQRWQHQERDSADQVEHWHRQRASDVVARTDGLMLRRP